MKKNVLYTVTKGNRPAFMPRGNVYGLGSWIDNQTSKMGTWLGGDKLMDDGKPTLGGSLVGGIGTVGGKILGNVIGGARHSGVGDAIGNVTGTVGSMVSKFNPALGTVVSLGGGILGGAYNALLGTSVDTKKLAAVNQSIADHKNYVSNAGYYDDIVGPVAAMTDTKVYGGTSLSSADKNNAALRKELFDAINFADRSQENNAGNISKNLLGTQLAEYHAAGGPLNPYGGALGLMQNNDYINAINNRSDAIMKSNPFNTTSNAYGEGGSIHISPSKKGTFTAAASKHGMGVQEFASKVLANKDDYSPAMVKKANFARNAAKWHAFGGELGTNGTDWTNGLLYVDGGGTHQQNPLGGVPVGFDQNGVPNLVEEGETIWNDYVFSNRMRVPKAMFHTLGLGGAMKKGLTFADASKKLAKESEQRPNDPISMAGLDASLSKLAAVQEAERMRKQMREHTNFAYGGEKGTLYAGNGEKSNKIKRVPRDAVDEFTMALENRLYDIGRMPVNYNAFYAPRTLRKNIKNFIDEHDLLGEDYRKRLDRYYNEGIPMDVPLTEERPNTSKPQREIITEEPVNVSSQDIQNAWDDVLMGYTSGNNTVAVPTVESSPSVPEVTFSAPIDSYNLENMIMQAQNPAYTYQQPSSQIVGNSGTRSSAGSGRRGFTGLLKYDRYLNGSDGVGTPTGFTVDANGKVLEYTPEYIEKAKKLTAADVRNWVAEHPDDVSYLSFRDKGNNLDTLTDDQASRGAIDGDYGFLHHVVDSMLQEQKVKAAQETPDVTPYQNTPAYAGVSPAEKGIDDAEREAAAVPANEDAEALADTNNTKTTPVDDKRPMLDTRLRYAPVWGSALSVLSDMFNTPDYTYPDKLEAVANAAANTPVVNAQPIGDYMRYSPFDRLFYANQLQANARATDRALGNTASPSAAAGVLANAYNTNNSLGNLYRQAEEYNLAQRQQTADFNRRTNMFNSQMGLEAALANARNKITGRGQQMQGLAQVASLRDAIDKQYSASRSANLTNFFNNLGNIGRENFIFNQINNDPSRSYGYNEPWTGVVGYWPKFMEDQYQKWYDEQEKKKASQAASATTGSTTATSEAYGGKLKRNKK